MSGVYTKRLVAASGGSQSVFATAPAGMLWVIKHVIIAFSAGSGAVGVVMDDTSQLYFVYAKEGAAFDIRFFDITQALPAGHNLKAQIADPSNATTIVVTGYEFAA